MRSQPSIMPWSDAFDNVKARALIRYQAGIVINGIDELRDHLVMRGARLESYETLMQEASTPPEPRAPSAQPQPAACWRLMLFVVTKERTRAKTRARTNAKMTARRRTLRTLTGPRRGRRNAFTAAGRWSARSSQQTRPSQLRKESHTTSVSWVPLFQVLHQPTHSRFQR